MDLNTSTVYKCLEKKTLILGFEIFDLFALSIVLCVLNFLFDDSSYKLFYTFIPTVLLGAFLKISKKGQAEGYLLHLLRYHMTPGIYSAFPLTTQPNDLMLIQKRKIVR